MINKFEQSAIVNFLRNYGFVFPCSEIYGGLANAWDYGPLGVALKNNIKNQWWKYFITTQPNIVGLDSSIILNSQVWTASGHVTNFSDPLIECKKCHQRFRVDKLIQLQKPNLIINENSKLDKLLEIIKKNKITCPNCKKSIWTNIRKFNLMFKTHQSVIDNTNNEVYLRPETAQGIFINFSNIQRSLRLKVPFGVGQIGKAFRNEITPGNFIFRTREFEQMELEYFTYPEQAKDKFEQYIDQIKKFLMEIICLNDQNIKIFEHNKHDLSHYSTRTIDFQYHFPHGWAELWGLANRTDFDLKNHSFHSKNDLSYLDPQTNKKFIPYVIEPSVGVERLFYAIICDKYTIQTLPDKTTREVLQIPYILSPYKVAILPLSNKLANNAYKIYQLLIANNIDTVYDTTGSIGKRYRRQDAIGTYYCVTYDFDSIMDNCVTIRNRDTMKQKRIKIDQLISFVSK